MQKCVYRFLSFVMAVTLTLSMSGVSALAATTETPVNEQQVVQEPVKDTSAVDPKTPAVDPVAPVQCTKNATCTLADGHEGNCALTPAPAPVQCTKNATCTLADGHEGECALTPAPAAPVQCAKNPACTLADGHEGKCALTPAPAAPEKCTNAPGCTLPKGHEGECVIGKPAMAKADTNVAMIGTAGYATLAEAVTAAKDGETITLVKGCAVGSSQLSVTRSIILDLNGQQLTAGGMGDLQFPILVSGPTGKLIVRDSRGQGTYKSTQGGGFQVANGAIITLESGTIEAVSWGIYVCGTGSTVNINGGKITVSDATGGYCVSGNGLVENKGTIININGGELDANDTAGGAGIYHPQDGVLNINGGVISGYDGVQLKAGTVNMKDGTILSRAQLTATEVAAAAGNNDGMVKTGCGISLISATAYEGQMRANISGGSIGANTYALYESTMKGDTAKQVISVDISGGAFKGDLSSVKFNNLAGIKVNIAGSTHNDKIFLDHGGKRVGFYNDLAEAVTAAKDGDTITVSGNITVASTIAIDKNLTIVGAGATKPVISGVDIFNVTGTAKLTLKNLGFKLTSAASLKYIIRADGTSTMDIQGCDFGLGGAADKGYNVIQNGAGTTAYAHTLIFKNNTVTGAFRAAITAAGNNSIISDNTFDINSEKWGDKRTGVISVVANGAASFVQITNNTFKGANRGIGVDNAPALPADKLIVTGNKFIGTRYAFELGTTVNANSGTYNLSKNYYSFSGETPAVSPLRIQNADITTGEIASWAKEYTGDKVNVYPYYSDAECTQLVYQNTPVADAVNTAIAAANNALAAANLSGKTLANLTEAELLTHEAALKGQKVAIGAALNTLSSAVSAQSLEQYLAANPAQKAQIDMLRQVYVIAFEIAEKGTDAVSTLKPNEVAMPTLPAGAPAGTQAPTQQQTVAAATDAASAITSTDMSDLPPEGLAEALAGTANLQSNLQVTILSTLTDLKLEAVVKGNGIELVPQQFTFEIHPQMAVANGSPRNIDNRELNGTPITFYVAIPTTVTAKYARIDHLGAISYAPIQEKSGVTCIKLTSSSFSPFVITFTNTLPSSGSSDNDDSFWDNVVANIRNASAGDVLKVNAKGIPTVPAYVLTALKEKGATLVLTGVGDKDITIHGKAVALDSGRIYYTMDAVAAQYKGGASALVNPETGGMTPGGVLAPQAAPQVPGAAKAESPMAISPSPKTIPTTSAPALVASRPVVLPILLVAGILAAGVFYFLRRRKN